MSGVSSPVSISSAGVPRTSFSKMIHSSLLIQCGIGLLPGQPVYGTLQSYKLVRNSGGRLLLTGHGGDAVMGNFVDYYFDVAALLREGRVFQAVRVARARALAAKRTVWNMLYRAALNLSHTRAVQQQLAELFKGSGGVPPATDKHIAEAFLLKPEYVVFWKDAWTRLFARVFSFPTCHSGNSQSVWR